MIMHRRTLLKGSVAALATTALGFPSIIKTRASDRVEKARLSSSIRLSSYGGGWQEALTTAAIQPFEEEYGVQVVQSSHASEGELIARMRAAGPGEYDIITVNESGLYLGVVNNVFDPLRLENIPNYQNIIDVLQKPPYDPKGVHSIPDVYGSTAIVYNSDHVIKP